MIGGGLTAWLPREDPICLAAEAFGLSVEQLRGSRSKKPMVEARAALVLMLATLGKPVSLSQLGREMGGRDHSTVANWKKKALRLTAENADFSATVDALLQRALPLMIRATSAKELAHGRH